MEMYQLWTWTPLDESLQWLRRATPKPKGYHSSMNVSDREEFKLSRLLGRRLPECPLAFNLAAHSKNRKKTWHPIDVLAPRPISLRGLDMVFRHMIMAQPPKWSGTFHVSEKSAFSRVVSKLYLEPPEQGAVDAQLAMRICSQLLYAILLLYTTYKKCVFTLQHAKSNPARNDKPSKI